MIMQYAAQFWNQIAKFIWTSDWTLRQSSTLTFVRFALSYLVLQWKKFSQLHVTFVSIPHPLVDLANGEAKAVCQSFNAIFLELGILVPLANQRSLLLEGFRLVITFLLFEDQRCHSVRFFFRVMATFLLKHKKRLRFSFLIGAKWCRFIQLFSLIFFWRLWDNAF
jgi:hypothetical protein